MSRGLVGEFVGRDRLLFKDAGPSEVQSLINEERCAHKSNALKRVFGQPAERKAAFLQARQYKAQSALGARWS